MRCMTSDPMDSRDERPWWALGAVGAALFLTSLDVSIVNIALPTLMRHFDADFPTIQWVGLAVPLALTVLIVGLGRLSDIAGKKKIFVAGLTIFTLASAASAAAPDVGWLIGLRFVQGVGAAAIMAVGVAIVTEIWPAHERGKALGISTGLIGLGVAVGPALGGVIIEAASWRWIFLIMAPAGLVTLAVVAIVVPGASPRSSSQRSIADQRERFDWAGEAILGGGLLALAIALTVGQRMGFGAPLISALWGIFALSIPVFLWVEGRARSPIIDLALFRSTEFTVNLLNNFLTMMAVTATLLVLPFYLALVRELPARQVGLLIAVVPLALGVVAPLSGILSDRLGTRPVIAFGLLLLIVGYLATGTLGPDSTAVDFVLRFLPVGLGMATFQSPNTSAIMGAVSRQHLGLASGLLSMTRAMGQLVGITVLGAFFASRVTMYAGPGATLESAGPTAMVTALRDQLNLTAALVAVGLLLTLWQWRRSARPAFEGAHSALSK